MDDQYLLVSV